MKKVFICLGAVVLLFCISVATLGWHSTLCIIRDSFQSAEKADIANQKVFENACMKFSYPGNWKIDTEDPSYNPEIYFDINPPGGGVVLFMVNNKTLDIPEALKRLKEDYKKIMPNPGQNRTFTYGTLEGEGMDLKGFMLVAKGKICMFGKHFPGGTLFIVEQRYDEDENNNKTGYDLIRNSIVMKGTDQ